MTRLERYALIADIVSGAAIVVTIVVLILEVRTNSALLERQIELDRIDRLASISESDYLVDVLAKIKEIDSDYVGRPTAAFMDRYGLGFAEADRWVRYLRRAWQSNQADYLAGQLGGLEEQIAAQLEFPDQALYWQHSHSDFDPRFVNYVSEIAPNYETVLDDR